MFSPIGAKHYETGKASVPSATTTDPARPSLKPFQSTCISKFMLNGCLSTTCIRIDRLGGLRRLLASSGPFGRAVAKALAAAERGWRATARVTMPEARGDVRSIIGQPFFVPLYNLFLVYGGVFMLSFGPKVSKDKHCKLQTCPIKTI